MRLSTGITVLGFFLGALASLPVLWLVTRKSRIPKGACLPPGPPRKFIIGNVTDMPSGCYWETFDQWAKKYGNVVYIDIFGLSIIFLNSLDVVHELFETRSAIYSDRRHSTMVVDLMGMDWNIGLMPYGEWWRRHRRLTHEYFHPKAVVKYHDVQTRQARAFLQRLYDSPADLVAHIRHFAGATIMEVMYGIKALPKGDPYIEIAEIALKSVTDAAVPGRYLVEVLPFLKHVPEWMPGAGFRRKAIEANKVLAEMRAMPFEATKEAIDSGTAQPSILATLLEDLSRRTDAPADEEMVIRNVAGISYAAGADTTVSVLTSFMLAMILYPEVQRKAQAELDSVIGNRLPSLHDLENLPYVNAVCQEAQRWHPAFPLGVPHRVMEDNVYGKYFIPKGSIVIANVWTILHDEKAYGPNPDAFEPERFFRSGVSEPVGHFGFGRRICPGRYMAAFSVQIAVASFLKIFDITPAKDDEGNDIPVAAVFNQALVSHAEPFRYTIKPRSELARALLENLLVD